jgi:16S rRNA (uracil1498-N3)-methyltransferase
MQLFYAPDLSGDHYTLSEQESKHCIRVLRMQTGDSIHLTDGKGNMFQGELISDDPRRCEVRINEVKAEYGKRRCKTYVAIAPTKNINRFEWFLEKATEIGVDVITPMISQRSERKVVKTERLNKVITAALKQSVKAYHPVLEEATPYNEFIQKKFDGDKFIAYVEEGDHPPLQNLYSPGNDVLIMIGPEGDFSPEEVKQAIDQGFKTVSLGGSRLRTETAGVVACHTISLLNREQGDIRE